MTARARKPLPAPPPDPTLEEEEAAFLRSLERHRQAVEGEGPLPPGATHTIYRRAGAKKVRRKRFTAV